MGENLHASDRLVIASQPVPDELLPLDFTAGREVHDLIRSFLRLSPEHRAEVRAFAESLPQHERTAPARLPSRYLSNPGPGGVVLRLLANRNLDQLAVAKSIYHVTAGVRYWSGTTYGLVGDGRKELTPDLLGDLAVLLDIPFADVEALTGIAPQGTLDPEVGDLVWEVRRLTRDQVESVREFANGLA